MSGNEERGLRSSYTAQPQQKWKDKKYGWVPNAKRNKSLFGNELLPRFYDSFRERAGSDPSVMRKMLIAERDRRYSVVQDVRKCQASYQCLVSDNPACAGQFLCEKYHPKPHDNSNISRCEAEANKLKKEVETIKSTIAAHDDSLFSERTGKLQTGLTCHHKFNSDTLHLISTGIQDNIAQLIEDLKTASKNYKTTYYIGSKNNVSKSRRRKEDKRKTRKRSSLAVKNRKSRASVIFLSLGGTPVDVEYEPEKYGVPQIDNVDRSIMSIKMFLVCLPLALIKLV